MKPKPYTFLYLSILTAFFLGISQSQGDVPLWNGTRSQIDANRFSSGYNLFNYIDDELGETLGSARRGNAKKLVVIIHGWNPDQKCNSFSGIPKDTLNPEPPLPRLLEALDAATSASTDWDLITYHWERDAATGPRIEPFNLLNAPLQNSTNAAVNGSHHGLNLAQEIIAEIPDVEKVHLIAWSAGSWVADYGADYLQVNYPSVEVQVTLLDPFVPAEVTLSDFALNTTNLASSGQSTRSGSFLLDQYYSFFLPGTNTALNPEKGFSFETSDPYEKHQGPVNFYADTIRESYETSLPALADPSRQFGYDSSRHGWNRSIFMNEPVFGEGLFSRTFTDGQTVDIIFDLFSRKSPSGARQTSFDLQKEVSGTWQEIEPDFAGPREGKRKIARLANLTSADAGIYRLLATREATPTEGQLTTTSSTFRLIYEAPAATPIVTDLAITSDGGSLLLQSGETYTLTATASLDDNTEEVRSVSWSSNSSEVSISEGGIISVNAVTSSIEIEITATLNQGGNPFSRTKTFFIVLPQTSTPQPPSTPDPPVEIVDNGGFEQGLDGWTSSGDFRADSRFSSARSGSIYAYLANSDGTPGNNLFGSVRQEFTIPASADSATLEFYLSISTDEIDGDPDDTLSVSLFDENGQILRILDAYSELDATGSYQRFDFDLRDQVGKTFSILFVGTTNSNFPTVFRIDDVSVLHSEEAIASASGLTIIGASSIDEGTSNNYQAQITLPGGGTQEVSAQWSENSSSLSVSSSGRVTASNVSSNRTGTLTARPTPMDGTTSLMAN